MSGKETTLDEMSIHDVVALIASTAAEAQKSQLPVRIAQKNGMIAILITGWMMDEQNKVVRVEMAGASHE